MQKKMNHASNTICYLHCIEWEITNPLKLTHWKYPALNGIEEDRTYKNIVLILWMYFIFHSSNGRADIDYFSMYKNRTNWTVFVWSSIYFVVWCIIEKLVCRIEIRGDSFHIHNCQQSSWKFEQTIDIEKQYPRTASFELRIFLFFFYSLAWRIYLLKLLCALLELICLSTFEFVFFFIVVVYSKQNLHRFFFPFWFFDFRQPIEKLKVKSS